jgi:hypothetical protein
MQCNFISRQAYRIAGSFNNFHGRLHSLFYVLSDDRMGSMPRFAPGSLARRKFAMEVDPEVIVVSEDNPVVPGNSSGRTPATPRGLVGSKRKAGDEGQAPEVHSKLRPRP